MLRRWFGFSAPVGRRFYFVSGALLMALKYGVDALIVFAATGRLWTPLQWLAPIYEQRFRGFDLTLTAQVILALWALPFMWIGVSMTLRRAVDAGGSAWWALLFFVPLVNLGLMLAFSALPSVASPRWAQDVAAPRGDEFLRSALIGVGVALALGLPLVALQTLVLKRYEAGLFFGVPFGVGAVCAFLFNARFPRSLRATSGVVITAIALLGGAILLYALEGLLCILMAAPIGLAAGALGGVLGREIALRACGRRAPAVLSAIVLPLVATALVPPSPPPEREVVSAVEIAAPPEVVWRHVVGFPPLPPPREALFLAGVAYPVGARIAGQGVGAVRRCEFSTGDFVEPITRWDEPRTLGFDVSAAPPPMEEWSPYARVFAPHLASGFHARRGEFRLIALPGGHTRLEGSTWYTLEIRPALYWTPWADAFVHRIHLRVLEHVRRIAERDA